MPKLSATHLAIALIGATLAWQGFASYGEALTMSWDAFGYYYYLPLTFFHDSLVIGSLDEVRPVFDLYKPSSSLYQFTLMENGNFIIRYPSGQALLYTPFFLIGHLGAVLFDFPLDGFSRPYDFAMRIGAVFYHTLGFYFIGKLLSERFEGKPVAITLLVLFFGTNAMVSLPAPLYAHGSLIFLLSVLFLATDRFFKTKSTMAIVTMSLAFGLACLCRPTDIIAVIPVLLWPWFMGRNLRHEWTTVLTNHRPKLYIGAGLVCAMAFIQLAYWHHMGGSWFVNSYDNAAEGLDFLSPHTLPFLFGFKTGWFVYTPLMLLVVVFLAVRAFKGDKMMQVVGIYLVLFIYIASSWTNYWYGGAFSQRAMIQAYVLLAFPLAGLIVWVKNISAGTWRYGAYAALTVFCVLNIWQSTQFLRGVITPMTMTREYYFASFFDYHIDPEKRDLLSIDRAYFEVNPVQEVPAGYRLSETFEYPLSNGFDLTDKEFALEIRVAYRELCPEEHCWLKLNVKLSDPAEDELFLVTHFENEHGLYYYRAFDIARENPLELDQFLITPHVRNEADVFKSYIWNKTKNRAVVGSACIEVYAPITD